MHIKSIDEDSFISTNFDLMMYFQVIYLTNDYISVVPPLILQAQKLRNQFFLPLSNVNDRRGSSLMISVSAQVVPIIIHLYHEAIFNVTK